MTTLLPLLLGVVYTRLGWTMADRAVGDLCINGKPEPSPFPQVRDLAGMALGFVAALTFAMLLAPFAGPLEQPGDWSPLGFLIERWVWA